MIQSSYPISETNDFLTITIGNPEADPGSDHGDRVCEYHIQAPNYQIKRQVFGLDDLQCYFLSFLAIKEDVLRFERITGRKCEYTFFVSHE